MKAAIAYEQLEDYESAYDCYAQIVDDYVESSKYQDARKHKARLEGKLSG
jgi:hypothetical protein